MYDGPGNPPRTDWREDTPLEQATSAQPTNESSELLVARDQVIAARARMFVPSDTTAGKSDGND